MMQRDKRFSAENIGFYLKEKRNIVIFDELESTNTTLKGMAENGESEGTTVIAYRQSGGRGKLGRTFFSPDGGIYMSLLLRPKADSFKASMITVAAASAVAAAIEKVCGIACGIKWVNDIFYDGKKICGILTEAEINHKNGMMNYAILGIGINLYKPKNGFPRQLSDTAGYLFENRKCFDEAPRLIAEIVNRFFDFYYELDGKKYLEEYRKRSVLIGSEIVYTSEDGVKNARVTGIDDCARLVIEENGREIKLSADTCVVCK